MERNLKSIKQFVRENGITEQAVYKKMKQENSKKRLNGHITKLNGAKCLDEIAQEILSPCNQNKGVEMELTKMDIMQDKVFDYLKSQNLSGIDAVTKNLIGFHLINFVREAMR